MASQTGPHSPGFSAYDGTGQEPGDHETPCRACWTGCQDCPVELPVDTSVPAARAPKWDFHWQGPVALGFVILYSLTLAAGAGCVFYASIRPVSVPAGYFSMFSSWGAADLLMGWRGWRGQWHY
jgi:hypothetical protein